MVIDISRFHGVFFEESKEHLNSLESLLLGLDLEKPDSEHLNAIFRAIHTIKGGSATFGFDDISTLSHQLENILDRLRKQQIKPEKTLVNTLLEASDVLRAMLHGHIMQQPANLDLATNIQQKLNTIDLSQTKSGFVTSTYTQNEIDGFELFEPLDEFTDEFTDELTVEPKYELENNSSSSNNSTNESTQTKELSKERTHHFDSDSKSIRVSTRKIDDLINLVGELVITESILSERTSTLPPDALEGITDILSQLQLNLRELQDAVISMRMMPIGTLFSRFPRLVHDLSAKLNKEVNLRIEGEETELDKNLIENMADPLMHLIRNSMDHGIEPADIRKQLNKPEKGLIKLTASHHSGGILIEISDDGGGLNEVLIIEKAKQRGMTIPEVIDEDVIWHMISQPGFSTAQSVTDTSGRGVGVDVVNRNVADLGGFIKLKNRPNHGCTFSIHLPLTLAIMDGMVVSLDDTLYVIPLGTIVETLKPREEQIKSILDEDQMLHIRDEYIPIIAMHKAFNMPSRHANLAEGMAIIVEAHGKKVALFLDEIVGQKQVVIKSLETNFRRVSGISGATVLGNGTVALIIDVPTIIKRGQYMYADQTDSSPAKFAKHMN